MPPDPVNSTETIPSANIVGAQPANLYKWWGVPPPEVAKSLPAAREHDDLDIVCLARQYIEHPFDTVVVRVHDRIV